MTSISKWIVDIFQKKPQRQNIHFLHIGKTGGTAIVYALNQHHYCIQSARRIHKGLPDIYGLNPYLEDHPIKIYIHPHNESLYDVPKGEKVFFFLRDPISRFISAFYSRQRQGKPRHNALWNPEEKIVFERFSTVGQLAQALSSTNPEEKAMAEHAMRNIRHLRDSYWNWFGNEEYFKSRIQDIFFVGFQENLASDFELLKSKLKLPQDVRLPTDENLAHKNPPDLDKNINEKDREILKKWYQDDFAFIRLCKEILPATVLATQS